ncbi:nucleotidyl transferase AbiEii/AbiGii toxin family protein [Fibrobacterota bacterium]
MINPKCFTLDWIQEKRSELKAVDPGILEKSIHALALLGHLADSELDFVFKGGTSLLLHLSPIRRLSIDIDIVCGAPANDLERVLNKISSLPPFNKVEPDERGNRGLPKRRHFKFFYNQIPGGHPAPFVLLDVVEESEYHLPLIEKPIITEFLEVDQEVQVKLPTVEGLLGDKLTAFAPNTIGVPFQTPKGVSQTMQVVKQLFDIGELFNFADDTSSVSSAYQASFEKESLYRGNESSKEDTLNDTIESSRLLCGFGVRGFREDGIISSYFKEGTTKLNNHLVNSKFRLPIEAKVAAAKAGYLAGMIMAGKPDVSFSETRFKQDNLAILKDIDLQDELSGLNRLKAVNPEAFHYWWKMQETRG